MKSLIIILATIVSFTSCKKEVIHQSPKLNLVKVDTSCTKWPSSSNYNVDLAEYLKTTGKLK